MKFYINRFGSGDSGLKFTNRAEFIDRLNSLIDEAEKNGEQAFEILWDSGEDNE